MAVVVFLQKQPENFGEIFKVGPYLEKYLKEIC